jgi:hypothetical protein
MPGNPGRTIIASRSAASLLGRMIALISFMLQPLPHQTSDKW